MTAVADLKALLEALDALSDVYRQGEVPDGATFPYVSILSPISSPSALAGDGRTLARREMAQVDLWQDRLVPDDDLLPAVVASIDGAKATAGFRFRVLDAILVPGPEEDEGIIHHAITTTLARVG